MATTIGNGENVQILNVFQAHPPPFSKKILEVGVVINR